MHTARPLFTVVLKNGTSKSLFRLGGGGGWGGGGGLSARADLSF